jgi:hypothetical protein
MSTELQAVLGIAASVVALIQVLTAFGWFGGSLSTRIVRAEAEIEKLRLWRHEIGNLRDVMGKLEVLTEDLLRLTERVERLRDRWGDR